MYVQTEEGGLSHQHKVHSILTKTNINAKNVYMNLYSALNEHNRREVAPSIVNMLKLFLGLITRCNQIAGS